jgi:hypothetical protein
MAKGLHLLVAHRNLLYLNQGLQVAFDVLGLYRFGKFLPEIFVAQEMDFSVKGC